MTLEPINLLVRRLREERRLKQHELAEKAGFDVQVVSRLEQGRSNIRSLTARALFQALAEAKSLTEHEAHDFLSQCGLIQPHPDRTLPARELNDYVSDGLIRLIPDPPRTFRDLVKGLDPEPAPPLVLLAGRLQAAVGLEKASHFLQVLLLLVEDSAPAAATPASPMLVHPPRALEDRTVQVIAPVTPIATPPAPSLKDAASRTGARTRKAR